MNRTDPKPWCLAGVLALLQMAALAGAPEPFVWQDQTLTVRTARLEMAIRECSVVTVRELRTDESFSGLADKPGLPSADAATFTRLGPLEASVTYPRFPASVMKNGRATVELQRRTFHCRVDERTGEILFSVVAEPVEADEAPASVETALPGLRGQSVILGCGARYSRDEPSADDAASRFGNGLHSPALAVIEGKKCCVCIWQDDPCGYENIALHHEPAEDRLTLTSKRPPSAQVSTTTGGWWRVGAFGRWEDAARRYRKHYEANTPARPLWENSCRWVRDIHAVQVDVPANLDTAKPLYARLAESFDSRKVLLFYWNGDRIILFGDHRYMTEIGRPKPDVVTELRKYGFRWIGYHPYILIMPPHELAPRLEHITTQKWGLPAGYQFQPDYDGKPDGFFDYLRPVCTGYYKPMDKATLWTAHPGALRTRQYLVRNFGDYCKFHDMDGAYMDVLGGGGEEHFPPEKQVMDGLDCRHGEAVAQAELHRAHPELATMSEYQTPWIVPYVFYAWEGETHFSLPQSYTSIRTRRNHPLRTALWGSYCWSRENELDPAQSALMGALPEISLASDWSMERAKIFTREGLFNDLPEKWAAAAIAYYRSTGGHWFQYRRMPFGEALVELTPGGMKVRLGRFIGQTDGVLDQPVRLQNWVAYRKGKPFGLDPRRIYPFTVGTAAAPSPLAVTKLSTGVWIETVRDAGNCTVIELGRAGQAAPGEITLVLDKPCPRIIDADGEKAGPVAAGQPITLTTAIPGGIVLVWNEPQLGAQTLVTRLQQGTGRTWADGTPHPGYYQGAQIANEATTLAGRTLPALRLGMARYRTFCQAWVDVPAGAGAKLEFVLGTGAREAGRSYVPAVVFVQVNGREVWRTPLPEKEGWQECQVPLDKFAARRVLLTVSLCAAGTLDTPAGTLHPAAFLGDLRLGP